MPSKYTNSTKSSNGKAPTKVIADKTVGRSASGEYRDVAKSHSKVSESDKLTMRAWKQTYKNKKSVAE